MLVRRRQSLSFWQLCLGELQSIFLSLDTSIPIALHCVSSTELVPGIIFLY